MKGQISMSMAVLASLIAFVGTIGTAWITSSAKVAREVSVVRTEVRVVEERENNHYAELQKQLSVIDKKLDRLINGRF